MNWKSLLVLGVGSPVVVGCWIVLGEEGESDRRWVKWERSMWDRRGNEEK